MSFVSGNLTVIVVDPSCVGVGPGDQEQEPNLRNTKTDSSVTEDQTPEMSISVQPEGRGRKLLTHENPFKELNVQEHSYCTQLTPVNCDGPCLIRVDFTLDNESPQTDLVSQVSERGPLNLGHSVFTPDVFRRPHPNS